MEQFVLIPASVYTKSLITQAVTRQELQKYQPSKNPLYHIDSLKNLINKKFFSKAYSLVDEYSSCPRIELSNSQTLVLDGAKTWNFCLDFAQQ